MIAYSPPQPPAHSWPLGRGYAAVVHSSPNPSTTWRTLEIRRAGRVTARLRVHAWKLTITRRDITGDGVQDVLEHDTNDGSGGCGVWRLYGGPKLRELWVQYGCVDERRVELDPDALQWWNAIPASQTPESKGLIHCCFARWWHATWRWSGGALRRGPLTISTMPGRPSY